MTPQPIDVLVGSFTAPRGSGEGLVHLTFDGSTLRRSAVVATPVPLRSPSFLAVIPERAGADVYVVEAGADHVVGFRWQRERPSEVELLGRVPVGVSPCHVAVNVGRGMGVVCAYGDGFITTFRRDADGTIGAGATHRPPLSRLEAAVSRAHCAALVGECVLTTDTGCDRVNVWRWDAAAGLVWESDVRLPTGSGPRHLRVHDSGAVFVTCEYSGAFAKLALRDGRPTLLELSTMPAVHPSGTFAAAEIAFSREGSTAFVGLRRDDAIAEYALGPQGMSLRTIHSSAGRSPRHHVVVGDALLVANQDSHEVVAFRIRERGRLELLDAVGVRSPTCLARVE
jgi:6-phosphogluconolactonase